MSTGTARLRELHVPGDQLILPNVWDAATAKLVEGAGFPAVATSSGAVAESLGYPDHQGAPTEAMLAAAGRIADAVDVPVTVDAEAGYGLAPAELAQRLTALGAAGANLEDTDHARDRLVPVDEQVAWLAAVRAAAPALVLNARVDVFLHEQPSLREAIARAEAYLDAGADCVYPIFLPGEHIAAFVEALAPAAVNLLCAPPKTPELAELTGSGAARISTGKALWHAEQAWFEQRIATMR